MNRVKIDCFTTLFDVFDVFACVCVCGWSVS